MHRTVQGARATTRINLLVGVGLAGLLTGCSSVPSSLNPVEWWHGLQGGKIAEDRPPPPGADEPYPNLGTVPARPPASDPKLRAQIADALVADRGNAQHEAEAVQLPDPSNPDAAPGLFGRGSAHPPAPAPAPGDVSARMPATAAASPAPSGPPPMATERTSGVARATVGGVQSAPLEQSTDASEPPRPALPSAPPAPANLPGAPASARLPPELPLDSMPTSTVAPSAAAGAETTATTAAVLSAATPPPAPAAPPAATPRAGGTAGATQSVGIPFASGSATVPRQSLPALRQLASRRGKGSIAITGFGEAAGDDPAAQQAALALALARAQAVAGMLTTAGVPASAIHVDAEATGRGAAARLIE